METRTWTLTRKSLIFTCSTDTSLIQLPALNAAFASDLMWWAKAQPLETLKKTIDNSLCFGVYVGDASLPTSGISIPPLRPSFPSADASQRES
jgi:hypothetical protein